MTITILFNGEALAYTDDPDLAKEVSGKDGITLAIDENAQRGGITGKISLSPFTPTLG